MKAHRILTSLIFLTTVVGQAHAQGGNQSVGTITTVVGGGRPTFRAGSNALESILEGASGVAVDADGNRYIAGFLAHRVFKIDARGAVTVFAGTGEPDTSGDGGAATAASINGPSAVAVEGGVVYIAEQMGNRIRRVDEKGIITTIAGTGKGGASGSVRATETAIDAPGGVAVRKGEVIFTEFGGNRVRRIASNGALSTLAGTGEAASKGDGGLATVASLHGPTGVVLDDTGNIYISEIFAGRVRRIDSRGRISTLAGGGPQGRSAEGAVADKLDLRSPNGLALDPRGILYVADFADNRVYAVRLRDRIVRTLAGVGKPGAAGEGGRALGGMSRSVPVESPVGLALDRSGELLLTLYNQGAVLSVDTRQAPGASTQHSVKHVAGKSAPAVAEAARATDIYLKNVAGVAVDSKGDIYVADVFANRVQRVSADGRMSSFIGTGFARSSGDRAAAVNADVHHPVGIIPVANGMLVVEADSHRIRLVNEAGNVQTVIGTGRPGFAGDGGLASGASAAHPHFGDTFGNYSYPADFNADAGTPDGGVNLSGASSFAPGSRAAQTRRTGAFFIFADTGNNRVRKVDERGIITTVAGNGRAVSSGDGKPAKQSGLNNPQDAVVDADGNIYIAEAHRVRKISRNGIITTYAGTGKRGFSGFGGPATQASITSAYGMAIDGRDLYIADPWAGVVYKVDEKGIITVVAGNGERRSLGDGGAATRAALNVPVDVAIRRTGNRVQLLIAELEGGRVRSVTLR